jgi:hypothetical protein
VVVYLKKRWGMSSWPGLLSKKRLMLYNALERIETLVEDQSKRLSTKGSAELCESDFAIECFCGETNRKERQPKARNRRLA